MNVVFYTSLNLYDDILAQTMELAKIEREKGNTVYFICCNSSIDYCSIVGTASNYHACITCQYKQRTVLKDFGIDEKNVFFLKNIKYTETPYEKQYNNIEEVKKYTYKGVNVGMGIASSFITFTRDIDADLGEHAKVLRDMFTTAHLIVDNMKPIFEAINPDKVYFFNGRFVEYRTVLEYCKHTNISFTSYEAGSTIQKYITFENTIPHDPKRNGEFALQLVEKNKKEALEQGERWYIDKRQGTVPKDKIDINYTTQQQKDNLPKSFESALLANKHIISIFNSSEDEMAALGQDIWKTYGRQSDIIEEILKEFEKTGLEYFFYLRIHPNQRNLIDTREVQSLIHLPKKYSNIEVILPDEDIDTYALLEKTHKTLSFGSTTGVESTFWGKPSVVYGAAFYQYIPNSAYFPDTFEKLIATLKNKELEPLSKEAAITYGNYISERGEEFEEYKVPLFTKENRFETKKNGIYLYLKLCDFLIKNKYPMRFFPNKTVYNLFLKK